MLLILAMATGSAYSQHGALTISRGLDQLSQEASLIVRGNVTGTRVEPHPQLKNLTTLVVSITVTETLKGAPGKSFKFRQYVWDIRDQVGTGGYHKGEELLLLLGPVSEYGLRSPVGLEQGRFRISHDSKGQAVAVNGRANVGLFDSVEQRASAQGFRLSPRTTRLLRRPQAGPVPLADLEDAIRSFGGVKR